VLPEFSITVRELPQLDVHVVALSGELDVVSADFLTDALVEAAASTVVVDLSGLTFMDCRGIGALVAARNNILASELGELVVMGPSDIVRKALHLVGLSQLIVEELPRADASRSVEWVLADRPRAESLR
jgi:anti-sigma B factor antagonist